MSVNIAIISGEISGDLAAGNLVDHINKIYPGIEFWGIGSRKSAAAGVHLEYDSSEWSAIGVIQVLKVYPKLRWTAFPKIVKQIARRRPAVVVLIDFGVFNIKVARECKKLDIPVLWYFPPGSWKQRGPVGRELATVTKKIATPFSWSEERLRSVGADAEFVGHPLLEIVKPEHSLDDFAVSLGLFADRPTIGLFPGSRGFEIEFNTPAMLAAAYRICEAIPNAQFVIGAASETAEKTLQKMVHEFVTRIHEDESFRKTQQSFVEIEKPTLPKNVPLMVPVEGPPISEDSFKRKLSESQARAASARKPFAPAFVITRGAAYDIMAHSDFLMVCSGTATLEAAILNTPMLIMYRGSKIMYVESKIRRIRPEHIGLPNIIAGKRIIKEFVQYEASPEALANCALDYLLNTDMCLKCKADLLEVRNSLQPPDGGPSTAGERTARMVLKLANLN